ALRPGGVLLGYVATTTQLSRIVEALREHGGDTQPAPRGALIPGWHGAGPPGRPGPPVSGPTPFPGPARPPAPPAPTPGPPARAPRASPRERRRLARVARTRHNRTQPPRAQSPGDERSREEPAGRDAVAPQARADRRLHASVASDANADPRPAGGSSRRR